MGLVVVDDHLADSFVTAFFQHGNHAKVLWVSGAIIIVANFLSEFVGDFDPASTVGLRYVFIYQERFGLLIALLPLPTYFNRTVLATPITDQVVTSCSKVMVITRRKGVVEVPKYETRSKMIFILFAVETSSEQREDKLLNDLFTCPTAKWIKPSQMIQLFLHYIYYYYIFYQVYQVHASCADSETNVRRSRLHPTHSILPYMCCAGPGSRGTSRIECFLKKRKEKKNVIVTRTGR